MNNSAFYNEIDPFAVDWLEQLILADRLPAGTVDRQDIRELIGHEVKDYQEVHLFAGIGGWPYALGLAGWPRGRAVWTGSCPCQPFSQAGKGLGAADERHLWPDMFRLIGECLPPTIFGEQVSSSAGREWLARVCSDLEELGYAVGCADLCAASQAAPHIRQRLFWVASLPNSESAGRRQWQSDSGKLSSGIRERRGIGLADNSDADDLPNGSGARLPRRQKQSARQEREATQRSDGIGDMSDASGSKRRQDRIEDRRGERGGNEALIGDSTALIPDNQSQGRQGVQQRNESGKCQRARTGSGGMDDSAGSRNIDGGQAKSSGDGTHNGISRQTSSWSDFDPIHFTDGKTRRIKSGTFPLAPRIPGRVAILRGIGNSIVPQVAASFIRAFLEAEAELKSPAPTSR